MTDHNEVRDAAERLLPYVRVQVSRGEPVDIAKAARMALDSSLTLADDVARDRRRHDEPIMDLLFTGYMEARGYA